MHSEPWYIFFALMFAVGGLCLVVVIESRTVPLSFSVACRLNLKRHFRKSEQDRVSYYRRNTICECRSDDVFQRIAMASSSGLYKWWHPEFSKCCRRASVRLTSFRIWAIHDSAGCRQLMNHGTGSAIPLLFWGIRSPFASWCLEIWFLRAGDTVYQREGRILQRVENNKKKGLICELGNV